MLVVVNPQEEIVVFFCVGHWAVSKIRIIVRTGMIQNIGWWRVWGGIIQNPEG